MKETTEAQADRIRNRNRVWVEKDYTNDITKVCIRGRHWVMGKNGKANRIPIVLKHKMSRKDVHDMVKFLAAEL